ncbi:hypothetical protein [Desulfopila inferna]|uniref:hypothetical protein n=1 Tax=Desulfopila inferna TaxID=468528 RepID=UPI001962383E|nr:hypothetical protein [Desulfopila inferna]MBM9603325.1 hypothetical protein [Desulfopila inferna]
MTTPETLYFPDTALLSDRQAPLFLLFSKVNIIQVVEGDEQSDMHPIDTYMDSRFCQALPLHPLGSDRDRFLYLINDIQNRKDDYAAQLSHITLASMSEEKSKDDETEQQIVSSLLGRKSDFPDPVETGRKQMVWQARLVLKIAEILDREEEEVAQALLFLEDSEADVFSSLKGESEEEEGENLYDDLSKLTEKMGAPRLKSIEKRLRAWFRFTDGEDLPKCKIWSTSRPEVADLLFENHEKTHNRPPEKIASIELPAKAAVEGVDIIEATERFHSICDTHITSFYNMVIEASSDITGDSKFSDMMEQWRSLLELNFPAATVGRSTVNFYRFSDPISCFSGTQTSASNQGPTLLALIVSH